MIALCALAFLTAGPALAAAPTSALPQPAAMTMDSLPVGGALDWIERPTSLADARAACASHGGQVAREGGYAASDRVGCTGLGRVDGWQVHSVVWLHNTYNPDLGLGFKVLLSQTLADIDPAMVTEPLRDGLAGAEVTDCRGGSAGACGAGIDASDLDTGDCTGFDGLRYRLPSGVRNQRVTLAAAEQGAGCADVGVVLTWEDLTPLAMR